MKIKGELYAERGSTVQTVIMEVIKEGEALKNSGDILTVYEYIPQESKVHSGDSHQCKHLSFNKITIEQMKAGSWKHDEMNSQFNQMACHLENQMSIPYLVIDSPAGKLDWTRFKVEIRPKNEVGKRIGALESTHKKELGKLSAILNVPREYLDSSASTATKARSNFLKAMIAHIKADMPNTVYLDSLLRLIARREREILLYRKRDTVKVRRCYDENLLAQIDEMIWLMGDNYPFANQKGLGISTFKVGNDARQ